MSSARWFKGNLHTHTDVAGGDADAAAVVSWYRRHGYDFLVLSEHNHLNIFEYAEGKRRFKKPLMIPGEEVTARTAGEKRGSIPVHLGAIGISRVIEPVLADGVVATLQANLDAILEAGGIACINHPNFHWAFDHREMNQVTGASLMEVYNGIWYTHSEGGPGKLSAEQIWDGVLSEGRPIYGVAADDAHHYRDFHYDLANPGRGWVYVRSTELSSDAIVEALASGDFYASTKVVLEDLEVSQDVVRLKIVQDRDSIYTTRFTGGGSAFLAEVTGTEPTYRIRGDEGYVRATVHSSGGFKAWTQPVFLSS